MISFIHVNTGDVLLLLEGKTILLLENAVCFVGMDELFPHPV